MVEVSGVAREARRIRVGLVGAGNWAFHGHLRVLDLRPDYEVVAVYARRREAAEKAAQRYGIQHIAESIADLVALPDVDVVIVLTTAPQHEEAVSAAIAAGKHVYCEWPLTISTQRAEKIERLVRDAGIRHVVGLQRRLAPHNRYVRDLLAQGYAPLAILATIMSSREHAATTFRCRRSTSPQSTTGFPHRTCRQPFSSSPTSMSRSHAISPPAHKRRRHSTTPFGCIG